MLKTRWCSIFLWALEIRPLFAPKVVAACFIPHNICVAANGILAENDVKEGSEEDGGEGDIYTKAEDELSGNRI